MTPVLNPRLSDMLKSPITVLPSGNIEFLDSTSGDGGKTKPINRYKFYQKMHSEATKIKLNRFQRMCKTTKNCYTKKNT
jgi:hypothetical protein